MTKEYFNSKEDYLLFRKQFAAAQNHLNAKSHLEPADEWLGATDVFSKGTGTHRVTGWLTATHYILLNILRGKPPKRGFTPLTNKNKLDAAKSAWDGFDVAYNDLIRIVDVAKKVVEHRDNEKTWLQTTLNEFLLPLIEGDNELATKYAQAYGKHNPIMERLTNILAKIELGNAHA